ncbi:cytochrome P450 [Actinomadura sp. 9N407]|uniref:cytochrome P450 n=1 Tax=Actinomadura sp. 9N407 TaxID=3375154 RepID=UPI0037B08AE3
MTLQDIDLMDPRAFRAGVPYDHFRRLRRQEGLPVGYDTDGERLRYVVRHRDVARISRDTALWSSSPTTMTSVRKQENQEAPIITFMDGAGHTRLRKLMFKAFTPARLAALAVPIGRIVDSLLDEAMAKGEFDLAEDIALRLPLQVLAELLGVPAADREMVLGWARRTVNMGDPEYETGPDGPSADVVQRLLEYFRSLVAHRVREPADDLFSVLLAARLKDGRLGLPERLDPEEIAVFATTLITAGSETTYAGVSGAVQALLEFPAELERLCRDPGLIPGAVDEVLRWVTPVTHFARRATRDTEIAGRAISAGERVVMWYSSANRDEEVFKEPDRFDVTRSPNPHLTFGGGGPHYCIGNGLAAMEIGRFLSSAVSLLPRLEISGPVTRPETNFMNSVKHLPMRRRS